MPKEVTKLNKIDIIKFRGLSNIEINFGEKITLICGKNGTSKSTLLGVAAQIFSFRKDYSTDPEEMLGYKTLFDKPFESVFGDHFRFSSKYDNSSYRVNIDLYDAYFKESPANAYLSFSNTSGRKHVRPILRNNFPAKVRGNTSHNTTHPVIYLSLSRLIPVSERKNYVKDNLDYLDNKKSRFTELNQSILNKSDSDQVTATKGDLNSAVSHGSNYDHESVSVGEDNVGQLSLALLSFEKLKEEYKNYRGGMLLIDEADAGLFPAAQVDFIQLLIKSCRQLDLQVVMTSHSPVMIEELYNLARNNNKDFKMIYLSDTFGPIRSCEDWSWKDIQADLLTDTVETKYGKLPEINLYFEDGEAFDFYKTIVRKHNLKKALKPVRDTNIGCDQYTTLMRRGVKEFSENSIVVFDGDVKNIVGLKTAVKLPGSLPPDQLVFDFLLKLPKDDPFWQNEKRFSKPVFTRIAKNIINRLNITNTEVDQNFDLRVIIKQVNGDGKEPKIRKLFKDFYNHDSIQGLIRGKLANNPFYLWEANNPDMVAKFHEDLANTQKKILKKNFKFSDLDCGFLNLD